MAQAEAPKNRKIRVIMMLCFFLSPLASLVRLGFLLYENIAQKLDFNVVVPDTSSSQPSLVHLLNNFNSTMEELIQNIFSPQFKLGPKAMHNLFTTNLQPNPLHILASISSMAVTSTSYNNDSLESSPALKMLVMKHDLQLVLPFIFIFCFLLIGPLLIVFIRRFHEAGHGVYPGQQQNEAHRGMKKRRQKRTKVLLSCLEAFKLVSLPLLDFLIVSYDCSTIADKL
jgi:hypothetical protein